jgi:hypothetical protein
MLDRSLALRLERKASSPLFEIASVLVRVDHIARNIVNANRAIM